MSKTLQPSVLRLSGNSMDFRDEQRANALEPMWRTEGGTTTRRSVRQRANVPSAMESTDEGMQYSACSDALGYSKMRVLALLNSTPDEAQNEGFPPSTNTARRDEYPWSPPKSTSIASTDAGITSVCIWLHQRNASAAMRVTRQPATVSGITTLSTPSTKVRATVVSDVSKNVRYPLLNLPITFEPMGCARAPEHIEVSRLMTISHVALVFIGV